MWLSFVYILSAVVLATAFPNGAPADVCVKDRVNEPHHGAARSQSINSLPYEVRATSEHFHAGQSIKVSINAEKELFRGFFLQARDAHTNEWIGEFQSSPNTKGIPECAAITHADNKDKKAATFIWTAPAHKGGRVYFTGAIVQEYGKYWAEIIAKVPVPVKL